MISNIPLKFKEIVKLISGGLTLPGETFYEVLSAFASVSMGVQGETVNEILYKMLQPTGIPVTPNDTTYNYLCQLVYYMSERHILNDNITSKYAILDELYEALSFDRNPAPNRLVYYNDTQLNDSKYAVGSTFCGGTITAHIYNSNIKVGAIEFDRTVTDLESAAFRNTHINSISLPTEVVTIGDNAFFQCYYLEGYSSNLLPATITTIGDYAFASTDIRELRVPAGTTSIGHAAFTGIKNIVYTGTASYGQNDPYWGAYMVNGVWESNTGNLYSADGTIFACVGYPDSATSLTVASGVTTIGRDAIRNCTHLTSVTLPSSLTTIQSGAFIQCPALPAITIPSSVTSIGAFAFSGDTSLTITMLPTVPPTLTGSNEFTGVQRILVPESSYNDYITAWSQWSSIIDIIQVPLNFTANEANSTVSLGKTGTLDTSYEYSTDNVTWNPYNIGDTITLANVGDKVYFRGDNKDVVFDRLNYMRFVILGSVVGDGNIMSILDPTMQLDTAPTYCFSSLFSICHGLTKAPKLPAINLSPSCYRYMFENCINLTEAPELPATTLSDSCYQYMFQGCSSLTTVPALTATTLASRSYMGMFRSCKVLTELTVYANDITANKCIQYWLDETASGTTGILHSLGSADFTGQVPSNWNIFYGNLTVTSDTTISSRIGYENINVSNNAVLTISDTFVQALDTITVEAGSQIRVSPTSVLVAGEGGIVTADVDGLYLVSQNENTGTVVFNVSSSNTQPYVTLEMSFNSYLDSNDTQVWDHIACPMLPGYTRQSFSFQSLNEWTSNGWAYTGGMNNMVPYKAYNIAVASTNPEREPIHTPGTIMLFKGNLQGNTDYTLNLTNGTNPLGNAYTARIPIKYLLEKLNAVQGTAEVLWYFPAYDVEKQANLFVSYTLANIDSFDDDNNALYMSHSLFLQATGTRSIDIVYNDSVLAYYKQKYNF